MLQPRCDWSAGSVLGVRQPSQAEEVRAVADVRVFSDVSLISVSTSPRGAAGVLSDAPRDRARPRRTQRGLRRAPQISLSRARRTFLSLNGSTYQPMNPTERQELPTPNLRWVIDKCGVDHEDERRVAPSHARAGERESRPGRVRGPMGTRSSVHAARYEPPTRGRGDGSTNLSALVQAQLGA